MKKILATLLLVGLLLPGALANKALAGEDEIGSTDMLHFVMTVRWGNVLGEVTDKSRTNFDGSISTSEDGEVSLARPLLFERHNEAADRITSRRDPVSWNSLIFGHWDGVRVLVSSRANAEITIETTQGTLTTTARELFSSKKPIIKDVGDGKEIVVKAYPSRKRAFVAKIIWGRPHRDDYEKVPRICDKIISERGDIGDIDDDDSNVLSASPVRCKGFGKEDFSGSLNVEGGVEMKLLRPVRFERNDKITSRGPQEISWNSSIYGGVDGILVKFKLARNATKDTMVTLSFPGQDWSKSISLLRLYHEKNIKSRIKPGYGVFVNLWKPPNRRLLKAKGDPRVYMIEDGLKRPIPSPDVLKENGFDWNEVEETDADELEALPEGDLVAFPDGTLLKGDGPEVFVISDGQRRHVRSAKAFSALGYRWDWIKKVANDQLSLHPLGSPIDEDSEHPEGALIRAEGKPMVYEVKGRRLHPIPSPAVFNSNRLDWNKVLVVKEKQLKRLEIGDVLEPGDGALVREPDGRIYQIDGNKKRWVRTADDFVKAKLRWDKVVNVEPEQIRDIETGEDIVADDLD